VKIVTSLLNTFFFNDFFANYIKILLVCLQKVEQLLFIKRRRRKEQVLFHLIKAT
jgi:hypothetical protein